jgi:hypothetical protein
MIPWFIYLLIHLGIAQATWDSFTPAQQQEIIIIEGIAI